MTPADLDALAALRQILRHPLVREEIKAIVAEVGGATPPAPRALSVRDVAELQGVQPDAVLEWIHRKGLRAERAPGTKSWRIRPDDLEAFLVGERTAAPPVDLAARRAERTRALVDAAKGKGAR